MNALNGWTIYYGIPANKAANNIHVNSTTYVEGSGSISFTLPPNSSTGYSGAIERPININFNNASNFYFWFYINNTNELDSQGNYGISLQLTSNNWSSWFSCDVYSDSIQNGWTPIVIARSACLSNNNPSWSQNITAIEFRVGLNSSVKHNVTVNIDNLRENYGGGPFSKAQVILTFDGSWNSVLYNATPIMTTNHQRGTAFIVTNQIGENQSNIAQHGFAYDCGLSASGIAIPCLTATQLITLYGDGWDLSSHTVDHANLLTLTADDFPTPGSINANYELAKSYGTLKSLGFGSGAVRNTAQFFAYPNGAYSTAIINNIKSQGNYTIARALDFGIVQPNLYPNNPYNLSYRVQSIAMTPSVTPSIIKSYVNNVIAQKGLLVLTFHIIMQNPCASSTGSALGSCLNNSVQYPTANFTAISNYLSQMQSQGLLNVTTLNTYYSTVQSQSAVYAG